jgi:hypothetical protein
VNRRAIRFYENQGFEVVGHQSFVLGDDEQSDLVLPRLLGDEEAVAAEPLVTGGRTVPAEESARHRIRRLQVAPAREDGEITGSGQSLARPVITRASGIRWYART